MPLANACSCTAPTVPCPPCRLTWAGFWLGVAAGGFFDGILLHQILQWHHLLSTVQVGVLGSLRGQVIADGLFHGLMYLLALVGGLLFWRNRRQLLQSGGAPRMHGAFWMGFGAWHLVDALVSHWLTGIHRVRMDTDSPLFWDLLWVVVFGLVPLLIGLALKRRAPAQPTGTHLVLGLGLALLPLVGAMANLYPVNAQDATTLTVVMGPGGQAVDLLAALDGTDMRVLWSDPRGEVWVLTHAGQPPHPLHFYRHGAAYVSGTVTPAGCAAWFKS